MSRGQFNTFSYSEAFPPKIAEDLPQTMLIKGGRVPPQLIILRLLSGTANFTHHYNDVEIRSRLNYFSEDFRYSFDQWGTNTASLVSPDITVEDLNTYLDRTKNINHGFYNAIIAEVSQFLVHTKRKSHTAAFIYIYRLLEKISYAFPIIYSQQTTDYIQTFSQLKDMLSGKDKSELGFFKVFINQLFKNSALKDTSIDLNIDADTVEVQERIFNVMKHSCDDKIIHGNTVEPRCLSINFCDLGSFIISIRNKFFHYRNETGNIDSEKVVDSDLFFRFINKYSLQWICTIYLTILTHNLSDFQSRS